MAKSITEDEMLESTAKFFYNVFSHKYNSKFERMLVSGGGGNSMFVNAWHKPSAFFVKYRISGEAIRRLSENGHHINAIPHGFIHHNAKGAERRKNAGKNLHGDHNPGNVKVLHLIRDRVRSYDTHVMSYKQIIDDLKIFLSTIQTVDIITVEQDDKRTLSDSEMTKKQKDMLDSHGRDMLLNDTWEDMPRGIQYKKSGA